MEGNLFSCSPVSSMLGSVPDSYPEQSMGKCEPPRWTVVSLPLLRNNKGHVMPLESRHVFVDTSVIVRSNFQFTSGRLQQLGDLAKNKRIVIYLSDIVIREVQKKIREMAEEAVQKYSKFMKDAKILKNLTGSRALQPALDLQEIEAFLKAQFDEFVRDCGIQLLAAGEIRADRVLDRFFNVEPPFGTGKKHCEFRDAFNMEAIRQWVNDKGEPIYVLAGDSDLEKACQNEQRIHYVREIADYLKMVNEADNPDEAATLDTLLPMVHEQLRQKLEKDFPQLEFLLEDENGEVLDVVVNDLRVFLYPLALSKGEAIFDFMAEIYYSAHVVYDDPEMTFYDREEERRVALEQIDTTLDQEAKLQGQMFVSVDNADPTQSFVRDVQTEENQIWVQVLDTSEYPYK